MYTIKAYYPDAWHIPSNSACPTEGIITPQALQVKRESLTSIVNRLFDGEHDAVFNSGDALISNNVSHITLVLKI
ncbi:MAG: hypothetical protein QQW96_03845 [Tychonema bourrellyi B0820]|nr:hypothetical protein [Tychonema bourrellyi B0820]PJE45230.1 MAG: hypothetical protein CUR32_01110 [Flavobacterium sp.] [Flavobacterium sp. FEMGT703F]